MNNIVKFQDKELHTHDFNGLPGLSSVELANGLGYADESAVTRIYNRHSDEFTTDMVQTVKLTVRGLQRQIKVFSPRGCHLVAMFAHTPFAKAFRKWVLDVLDKKPSVPAPVDMRAIGGVVKKCAAVAVRDELKAVIHDEFQYFIMRTFAAAKDLKPFQEVTDDMLLRGLYDWYSTKHHEHIQAIKDLTAENDRLKSKMATIRSAAAE